MQISRVSSWSASRSAEPIYRISPSRRTLRSETASAPPRKKYAASAVCANSPFAQRASLYPTTVAAVDYPFTNSTGKAFYLRPSDNGVHGVDNLVDGLVRENQKHHKTTTEWRAGFIKNQLQLDECPSVPKDDAGNDKWTPVTQILNNIGTDKWVAVKVPDASVGALQPVTADNPL